MAILIFFVYFQILAETQHVQNNEKRDEDSSESDRDKRHIGRWKNFRYRAGSSSNSDNNDAIIDEKRHIGRWKNLNWKLGFADPSKRFFGRWRDLNHRLSNDVNKRHVGRWKNLNYLNKLRSANDDSDIEKRFLGRWKNPNYLLGANNNNQDDESMTDAEEYGYEIPVAENLMSELGDMNNMDKRFFGRWRNLNYKLRNVV